MVATSLFVVNAHRCPSQPAVRKGTNSHFRGKFRPPIEVPLRGRSLRMNVDARARDSATGHMPKPGDPDRSWQLWRRPWLRAFWNRAYKENITGLSGMVAYNLMLAVFPFALLVLFIFGQVVNSSDIELSVVRDIQRLFPNIEQDTLQHAIDRVRASSTTIGIAAVVGGIWIGASFWGAMDTAFCRIYHVECRGWVQQKRWSLVMLLALLLLLAASVTVPTSRERRADECRQPAVRPRPVGCSPDSDRRDRRPDRHLPDHLGDLLGRPQGPHAMALGLAGGALLRRWSPRRATTSSPSTSTTSPTCTGSAGRSASSSSPWSGSTRSAWRCSPAR